MSLLLTHIPADSIALRTTDQTSAFGTATGPIFLDRLSCIGSELKVLDCPSFVPGVHECDHSQDVGVECYGLCSQ